MQLPIINENDDEKNAILPCKDYLKIYFDGKLEINSEFIDDNRLKFNFGPIKVNCLKGPSFIIPYTDFIHGDNEQNLGDVRLFTKHGACGADYYKLEITNEQYDDLQHNFIDNIINILNKDHSIFDYIGKDILDRLYSLGWKHHERFVKFNDYDTLNVNNVDDSDEVSYCIKKYYREWDGREKPEEEIITLPAQKTKTTDQVSVNSRILMASNIIQSESRIGTAKYVIVGETNYSALLENSNFHFEQIENDNTIHIPNIRKAGTLYGKDVYVTKDDNPYVLLGRNEKSETGLAFLPYYIEPMGYQFEDEKIKIIFKIRYVISEFGFSPELNYFMFYHKINFLKQLG